MIDFLIGLQRPIQLPKFRLLTLLIPPTGVRSATIMGARFNLDLSDTIQRMVYIGCYERDESAMFRKLLGKGMTLVDIGANIGYFTALGAQLVTKTGRVISLEPNPSAYTKLRSMIDASPLPQCTPINIGLSDTDGNLTLYEPPPEQHNLNSTMVAVEGYKPISVPVRKLDDVLDELNVSQVDLMKVDVEGHEPKIFLGASASLAKGRIKHILCEFNRHWLEKMGSSPQELLDLLKRHRFKVIPGCHSEADLATQEISNLVLRWE